MPGVTYMYFSKYQDMAYLNSQGRKWLHEFFQPEMYNKYLKHVEQHLKEYYSEEYARNIFFSAVFNLGYIGRKNCSGKDIAQIARRLRRIEPPDRGAGVKNSGSPKKLVHPFGWPWEYVVLDEFLECNVRPLVGDDPLTPSEQMDELMTARRERKQGRWARKDQNIGSRPYEIPGHSGVQEYAVYINSLGKYFD